MDPYFTTNDGSITIFLGDCREVLPTLTDPVDLVLTDPPYEAEAHTEMRRTRAQIEGRSGSAAMPFAAITEDLRTVFVNESQRLCRGWCIAFCQAEAVGKYQELFGLAWRRPMVWVKPDAPPQFTGDRPAMGYESIAAAWMGTGRSSWNGGGRRGVFTCNSTDYIHEHPAQKPIALMRELVGLFSNSGDIVLDPFGGAGTTARACLDLGRRCIVIEKREEYAAIAVRRLQQAVLPLGDIA